MSSINNRNPPIPPSTPSPLQADTMAKNAAASPSGARPASKVELEQQQALQAAEPAQVRKSTAAETERMMAQSGFQRVRKRRGPGFDLDEASQAPIPLPVDEVDESAWEQRHLDEAQEELTVQGALLKQLDAAMTQEGEGPLGLFGRLLGHTFSPTEEDVARLAALNEQATQPEVNLETVHASLRALFNLQLGEVAGGPALVAASLVVAGLPETVVPQAGSLEAHRLCQGMQTLVESSRAAVEDGRTMSSGISKLRAAHQTFMFKR